MTVATAIVERLLSLSAVTALVSTRIRVMKLRQTDVLPAIKVQRVGETEQMHLRGSVGLFRSRVQVDSVALESSGADPYASATAVDDAVHGDGAGSGLCGWSGEIGSPAFQIAAILPDGVVESYDLDSKQVRMIRDYIVWHRGN